MVWFFDRGRDVAICELRHGPAQQFELELRQSDGTRRLDVAQNPAELFASLEALPGKLLADGWRPRHFEFMPAPPRPPARSASQERQSPLPPAPRTFDRREPPPVASGGARAELVWSLADGERCVLLQHDTEPAFEVSLMMGDDCLRTHRVYARASAYVLADQWRWTLDSAYRHR